MSLGDMRSDWLDAFADLEIAICRCASRYCTEPAKRNLAQRLKDLEALDPNARLSRDKHARLGALVAECRQLMSFRGTLVHSHMRLGSIDNSNVALFRNVADETDEVAMTVYQFRKSTENLRRLAGEFERLARPSPAPEPS